MYRLECEHYTAAFNEARETYFRNQCQLNSNNPRKLQRTINCLLGKSKKTSPGVTVTLTADTLNNYFIDKVATIYAKCTAQKPFTIYQISVRPTWTDFTMLSYLQVQKILSTSDKSCALDLIPTWAVKKTLWSYIRLLRRQAKAEPKDWQ